MPPEDPHTNNEEDPGLGGQLLPGWSSLVILLTLFGLISAVTMYAVMRGGAQVHVTPDTGGARAYGPADFPDVDFDEPLLSAVVAAGASGSTGAVTVPPPPFTDGIYPCSECHMDLDTNLERRELMIHDEIAIDHGAADRWCFDCHNPDDRDRLVLAGGETVGFDESYKLCGQCHGTIYRDWREGVHGQRRGFWNGAKSYLLCAHCHNPHSPAFKSMKPLPPPVRPAYLAAAPPGPPTAEEDPHR